MRSEPLPEPFPITGREEGGKNTVGFPAHFSLHMMEIQTLRNLSPCSLHPVLADIHSNDDDLLSKILNRQPGRLPAQ